ncbi:MAG: DUF2235 domain-containing protein [Motiliproteus sp.]
MNKLIICCDGTWNAPDHEDEGVPAPSNVYKLFCALDTSQDHQQLTRYQSGIGTGGLLDKAMGGAVGYGLSQDIRDCYQWLANKYRPGDAVYLFGFSRGAYTARSLAGMIGRFGIVKLAPRQDWEQLVKKIYRDGYRNRAPTESLGAEFHPDSDKVHFVGVWDTVGALGIPDDKALLNIFDNPIAYSFHDTQLGNNIAIARHAVALDEKRGSFTPTLWDTQNYSGDVQQLWFPGVHCDVGGGYKEHGLSDGALQWLIDEAHRAGLIFISDVIDQIEPNPHDIKHESYNGIMKALDSMPRSIPRLDGSDNFHPSVDQRRSQTPINQGAYLPTHRIDHQPFSIDIYAKNPWNWTGIYLQAGKSYQFDASGQWMDASIRTGPAGADDGKFHVGEIAHMAGTVTGWFEKGWKGVFGNEQANFFGTKRIEHADWFTLIGAVADGGNPKADGTPQRATLIEIGEKQLFHCHKSGYLYCFANDAWGFYHNNRGYLTLTIKQL